MSSPVFPKAIAQLSALGTIGLRVEPRNVRLPARWWAGGTADDLAWLRVHAPPGSWAHRPPGQDANGPLPGFTHLRLGGSVAPVLPGDLLVEAAPGVVLTFPKAVAGRVFKPVGVGDASNG